MLTVGDSGGWGFVVRNHLGDVMGSGASRCDDALHTEAVACLEGISRVAYGDWGGSM